MTGHIDINDDHELYIWARTFGITPDELVRWVSEVGPVAAHVRDALKRGVLAEAGEERRATDRKRSK
jgi:hypothetical protein